MLHRPSRWTWSAVATVVVIGALTAPALMVVRGVFGSADLQFIPFGCTYALMFTLAQLLVRAPGAALAASLVAAVTLSIVAGGFSPQALLVIGVAAILELAHIGTRARRWSAWRSYVGALAAVAVPTALLAIGTTYGDVVVLVFLPFGLAVTALGVLLLRLLVGLLLQFAGHDRAAGPAGQH